MRKLTPLLALVSIALASCAIGAEDDVATNERPYDNDALLDASIEAGDASQDADIDEARDGEADAVADSACAPSDKEVLGPCGHCGSEERECQEDGTFGEPSCQNEGSCAPDTIESQPCGACGTQTRACTESCEWGPWSGCEGQGVCMPGEVSSDSGCADECFAKTRTCTDSCDWGPCDFIAGAQCERRAGTNWQCCDTDKWQFCLSGCKWAPCQACSGNNTCQNACR